MKKIALIMAGGKGTRLWPLSTSDHPKQFVSFTTDKESLLQKTYNRVCQFFDAKDVFIITSQEYEHFIYEQINNISEKNIIIEPIGRNTAPALIFSSLFIADLYTAECEMFIFPADHYISDNAAFISDMQLAEKKAESDGIITIGISPTEPNTNYGYIYVPHFNQKLMIQKVDKFFEKPDIDTAKRYIESECFFWNSGIFIWKISSFFNELELHAQSLFSDVKKYYYSNIYTKDEYEKIKSISIDYALIEKSKKIFMINSHFEWSDLGSFDAISKLDNLCSDVNSFLKKNIIQKS